MNLIDKIKLVALHKDASLSLLSLVDELISLIEENIDIEHQEKINFYKNIIKDRLNNLKFNQIVHGILALHPELKDEIENINSSNLNQQDILSELNTIYLRYKSDKIIQSIKSFVTDIELETYTSIYDKIDNLKIFTSDLLNNVSSLTYNTDENELLIDEDIDIESQLNDDTEEFGISTGYEQLDKYLNGYRSGRIYVYMGGTGQGKSIWLSNAVYNLCTSYKSSQMKEYVKENHEGKKPLVVMISNENSVGETKDRLISIIKDIPFSLIESNYNKSKMADILKSFSKECGVSIYIKYIPPRTTTAYDILNMINTLERRGYKTIGVVVDYMDRLTSVQKSKEERHILGFITDELKHIGIKLKVPIITATQVNRSGHKSDTPDLTDVDESWKKIQNADAILTFKKFEEPGKMTWKVWIKKLRYNKHESNLTMEFYRDSSLRIKEHITENTNHNTTIVESDPLEPNDNTMFIL